LAISNLYLYHQIFPLRVIQEISSQYTPYKYFADFIQKQRYHTTQTSSIYHKK
jgi:hypothetical protein